VKSRTSVVSTTGRQVGEISGGGGGGSGAM